MTGLTGFIKVKQLVNKCLPYLMLFHFEISGNESNEWQPWKIKDISSILFKFFALDSI